MSAPGARRSAARFARAATAPQPVAVEPMADTIANRLDALEGGVDELARSQEADKDRAGHGSAPGVSAVVVLNHLPELVSLTAAPGSLRGKSDTEAKAAFGAALTEALADAIRQG